jgi:hypothetical protein
MYHQRFVVVHGSCAQPPRRPTEMVSHEIILTNLNSHKSEVYVCRQTSISGDPSVQFRGKSELRSRPALVFCTDVAPLVGEFRLLVLFSAAILLHCVAYLYYNNEKFTCFGPCAHTHAHSHARTHTRTDTHVGTRPTVTRGRPRVSRSSSSQLTSSRIGARAHTRQRHWGEAPRAQCAALFQSVATETSYR